MLLESILIHSLLCLTIPSLVYLILKDLMERSIFQECRKKWFWGFPASICSLLVSIQQTMINLLSRQAQNCNGKCVSGPGLRQICQAFVGNHMQYPLITIKKQKHKTKVKSTNFYISFILNLVFHPASFPHFIQNVNMQEYKIPFVRGQVSSVLKSYSQLLHSEQDD